MNLASLRSIFKLLKLTKGRCNSTSLFCILSISNLIVQDGGIFILYNICFFKINAFIFAQQLALRNNLFKRKGKHYVRNYLTYQTRDRESLEQYLRLTILRPDPTDRDFLSPIDSINYLFFFK